MAASMQGTLSEQPRTPLPEQPSIDELRAFVPPFDRIIKKDPTINRKIIRGVHALWQSDDYESTLVPADRDTMPWAVETAELVSPLTSNEQSMVVLAVTQHIRRDKRLRQIAGALDPGHGELPQSLQLRALSVVSDLAALNRVIAGVDYAREHAATVDEIVQAYKVENGVLTSPKSIKGAAFTPPQILQYIPWRSPCRDMVPTRDEQNGSIDTRFSRRALNYLTDILSVSMTVAPDHLRKPIEDFGLDDLRSPFRFNLPSTVDAALKHYSDEKRKILNMFFAGQTIEIPKAVRFAGDAPADALLIAKLRKQHEGSMQMLRDDPLGQRLIETITLGKGGRMELARAERLNQKEREAVSLKINGRLRLLSRIMYDLMPESTEDSVPPDIEFLGKPEDIIESITGGYAGRIRAVHLCVEPNDKSPDLRLRAANSVNVSSVIVVVEKRSSGHSKSTFEGAYFAITIRNKVSAGLRKVTIHKSSRRVIAEAEAELLAVSPEV